MLNGISFSYRLYLKKENWYCAKSTYILLQIYFLIYFVKESLVPLFYQWVLFFFLVKKAVVVKHMYKVHIMYCLWTGYTLEH